MKASELIQKLLELTQEDGKDLDVVTDYNPYPKLTYFDLQPEEVVIKPVNDKKDVIVIE